MRKNSGYISTVASIVLVIILLYLFRNPIQLQINHYRQKLWKQKTNLSNEELQTMEEALHSLKFSIAMLEEENAALRKQLEAPLPPELGLLPARVVGNSRYLYIDQGKQSGIKVGSGVISQEILIGTVFEVSEHSSKIRLLNDPDSKISVKTQVGVLGLLQGGDNKLLLTRVLQSDTLNIGDLLGTSGAQELPASILIGKVTELSEKETEVYQEAIVTPSLDYGLLTHVFVVM